MNEAFKVRLVVDGRKLGVDLLSQNGVTLGGESSASPRGFTVSLEPDDPGTEYRLRRVRQIQDWEDRQFKLEVSVQGGEIHCRGIDSKALPFGRYRLRMLISELEPVSQPISLRIPENGAPEVAARFRSDPRRLEFVVPVEEFDDRIKRIVLDSGSRLDGSPLKEWLADENPRARRKACLLNLLAKLRAAPGQAARSSLIDGVKSVFFGDVDRIYASVQAGFLEELHGLSGNPRKPFYFEGTPKSATHNRLLEEIDGFEPDAKLFRLQSFRQEGNPSMQAVVAVPPVGAQARTHYADLDLDLGNPMQDLAGALVHFGEVLTPGKTDHLKLTNKLSKGSAGRFIYHRVRKQK